MTTYPHDTALTPELRANVAAAAGDRANKPRFGDVAGIRLAHNLDSLSRDEIEATQQHNLRATLTAARQSANVWWRFPRLEAVDTVDDLAALPLLSAADLAAGCPPHSADLVFDTRSPGLVLRSSGTASRPEILYHSFTGPGFDGSSRRPDIRRASTDIA